MANFKEVKLTPRSMEVITGLMLGDGSFTNKRKSPRSTSLLLSSKHRSYCEYILREMNESAVECKVYERGRGGFEGSTTAYGFETRFYVTFNEIRDEWYDTTGGRNVSKRLGEFELTRTILLHWFLGDGYLVHLRGNPVRVQICTECFSDEELEQLRVKLEDFIGDVVQIDWNRRRLRIPTRALGSFYRALGDCPEALREDYGYKWRHVL